MKIPKIPTGDRVAGSATSIVLCCLKEITILDRKISKNYTKLLIEGNDKF